MAQEKSSGQSFAYLSIISASNSRFAGSDEVMTSLRASRKSYIRLADGLEEAERMLAMKARQASLTLRRSGPE
jgi:hypothetical protein